MEFFKALEDICIANNCYLEYVGDKAQYEYEGFENSWLIFSNDAKNGEYDLVVIQDTSDTQKFLDEFSSENNISNSHKQILSQLKDLFSKQRLN